MKEKQLESLNTDNLESLEIPEADYLITAKINSARIDQHQPDERPGASLTKLLQSDKSNAQNSSPFYTATTSVDFRFYEKKTKRTVLTKNIEHTAPGEITSQRSPEAISKLTVAAQECAKAFAMELGSRYAPPARVVEVRGNGQVAKVTMGSNYGLVKGVKVEFFEYTDNSDVIAGATREPSLVGYGIVLESDLTSAWLEILAPIQVIVRRGHYVRITSDQSNGLKEKFTDALRI